MPNGVFYPPFTNSCFFRKDEELEVVWAAKQPFIATSNSIDARYYDKDFSPIKLKRKKGRGSKENIH